MNKKFLVAAIAAATFGTQAVAVELYNNDGTTFSIGGHVTANLNGSEANDVTVGTNSPRINFDATQELSNGVVVDARGEWALNFLTNSANTFTTRLGYIGVTHEKAGRAVVGTQWAPYYDVAGFTDMPIAFANDFLYNSSGLKDGAKDISDFARTGQTRADNMVSYRNGVDFGNAGEFNIGLAWQGDHSINDADYGDRVQVALSYSVVGAQFGYGYITGDVNDAQGNRSLDYHVVSAKYGSYGDGLYIAGVYQMTKDEDVRDVDSYEVIAAYALANSLNLSINYETVESDARNAAAETEREEMALQAEYNFTPKLVGFAGYQFDLNDENGRNTDDKWTIGARFYL